MIIDILADGNILKYNEITELNLRFVFNTLSFKKSIKQNV